MVGIYLSFEKHVTHRDRMIVDFNNDMMWYVSNLSVILLLISFITGWEQFDGQLLMTIHCAFYLLWFKGTYSAYGDIITLLWNWAYVFKTEFIIISTLRLISLIESWYILMVMENRRHIWLQNALANAMYEDDDDDSDYGIDQEFIDMLHMYRYTRNCCVHNLDQNNRRSKISGDQCCICLESYKMNDYLRVLHCKHHMHVDCCDPWLRVDNSCPMCRRDAVEIFSYDD